MNFSGTARFRQSLNFFFQNHVNYWLHLKFRRTISDCKKDWTKSPGYGIISGNESNFPEDFL